MRTTLAIDDDVLAAAKAVAQRQRVSVGEVISELARQSLRAANAAHQGQAQRNGIPLLPQREASTAVTLEFVNQLRDEPG
jgi:hypothetical protein